MPSAGGMPLRSGVHGPLEEVADEILRQHLSKISRHQDKSDVLTPWKEADRRSHEVYVSTGVPDASLRRGIYTRGLNPARPHLNSMEGIPRRKDDESGVGSFGWRDE